MSRIDWVRSFVHRALRGTAGYANAPETPVAAAVPCRDGEILVGIYQNTQGETRDVVGITDCGLYLSRNRKWRFIAYEQIIELILPEKTTEPPFIEPHLDLLLFNGEVVRLTIKGRTGELRQYSDVYGLEKFLSGILWSLRYDAKPRA